MPPAPSVDTGKLMELRYVNRLTYDQISDMVGLSKSAIIERLERYRALFNAADNAGALGSRHADMLVGIRGELVARVAECLLPENREKVSAYQAMGMANLADQMFRLETGRSTANIATLTKIVESAQDSGDTAIRNVSIDASKPK